MIMDTWMLMPILKLLSGGDDGSKVTIPTQPLRMLRLFKLTRMARLMKAFPELVTMIKGLCRSLRAISSSMILVGLMVYTWAILLHMMMKDEEEFNTEMKEELGLDFRTITNCMWALLMDGTLMLDGTPTLMTKLLWAPKINMLLAGLFFVLYALLSALLILQMLIGVLCDVVSRVGQEQRDAQAIGLVKQEILADLKQFDGGDGKISQKELLRVMKHPQSKALMKKLNINRLFLMELQRMMFPHEHSQVTIKAVLELMILCRGDNQATVEAIAGGFCFLSQEIMEVKTKLTSQLQAIKDSCGALAVSGDRQEFPSQANQEKVTMVPDAPLVSPMSPRDQQYFERESQVQLAHQSIAFPQIQSGLRPRTPREEEMQPTSPYTSAYSPVPPAGPMTPMTINQQNNAFAQLQTMPFTYQQSDPRFPSSMVIATSQTAV